MVVSNFTVTLTPDILAATSEGTVSSSCTTNTVMASVTPSTTIVCVASVSIHPPKQYGLE